MSEVGQLRPQLLGVTCSLRLESGKVDSFVQQVVARAPQEIDPDVDGRASTDVAVKVQAGLLFSPKALLTVLSAPLHLKGAKVGCPSASQSPYQTTQHAYHGRIH
ncbi:MULTISPECIES: hypothetical protein [Streptomyces]|uniref:Uncharacterized protein n=1 Tax=Streptomyces parvus TaxID=66428 RepID=A0A5D4JM52_9ACTN|nr:hypothetical protein [Streptomyces parvus]TYR64653.1 hypothetical protein FY004_10450 [Streptomyces parvus]